MEDVATVSAWAEANFGTARLGDPRRTRRLVDAAAALAAHPEKSLPQVFDWNELRGFYRLCDRTEATLPALQRPHWERTRSAMAQAPLVLILHDTTELDFTSHRALRGAGPIGDNRGRGFLQHNSLAVVPQPRQVLGLAYQQWHVRRPAPAGETSYQRKRRPRESDWWREGMAATGPAPDGTCWVDVADRAGDDYQTLRAARAVGHHFLVRATQNRGVAVAADGPADVYLLDHARSLPAAATDAVVIPGRGGRAGRTAAVCLAAAAVWMPAPAETPRRRSQPVLPLWVIRVWEPDPPAEVDEPLEWILLCSLATATEAELQGAARLVRHALAGGSLPRYREERLQPGGAAVRDGRAASGLPGGPVGGGGAGLPAALRPGGRPRGAGGAGGRRGGDRSGAPLRGAPGGSDDGTGVHPGRRTVGRILGAQGGRRTRGPGPVAGLSTLAGHGPGIRTA
jgi:hypothetical protein